MDKGNFVLGGIGAESVTQAVKMAVQIKAMGLCTASVPDYLDENVSLKVVKIIQSYVSVINKMVWRKE